MPANLRKRTKLAPRLDCQSTVPFEAPAELTPQAETGSSLLLSLPTEILVQIFHLAQRADKIALALSCKKLLAVSQLCKLRIPERETHARPWAQKKPSKLLSRPYCACLQIEDVLKRARPTDSHDRLSRKWNLCVDCRRYRPTRKGYWGDKLTEIDTSNWDKTAHRLWQSAIYWFTSGVKVQCPTCCLMEWEVFESHHADSDDDGD
ncbi:hypothetical protein ACJ41O_003087 [Fusarium nematophilum]